ncbi:MAG TPA: glycosyltransferase [Terriglobales bacterium]
MKLAIFGLTLSSSWGNGHATLWRGLCKWLARQGHNVTFFEKDVPYYANHRDFERPERYQLQLYSDWSEVEQIARECVLDSDAAMVTSYCPDAQLACDLVLESPALKVFYDLDTAVTLEKLRSNESVPYLPSYGLAHFDLVLSYVGGRALQELKRLLGARKVAPLHGCVDPELHQPVPKSEHYEADLSYLGTYAADRQRILKELFLEPATQLPNQKFLVGGAQYPPDFPWKENVWFVRHVPPGEHPAFYCSSRATLNVTRSAMASFGYCPSGRLFEAAACATPIVSDSWEGLDTFFEPGRELLTAESGADVVEMLARDAQDLRTIGKAARERVLSEHTAQHRSRELVAALEASA